MSRRMIGLDGDSGWWRHKIMFYADEAVNLDHVNVAFLFCHTGMLNTPEPGVG